MYSYLPFNNPVGDLVALNFWLGRLFEMREQYERQNLLQ